ncbi:MAG: nitroreductase family protein [Anaerolineae bacterium]|nr:nitroreductase family protein [Anaerolineae bacterium]
MSEQGHVSPEALLSLIKSRRSVRRYLPDPVPTEMVEQVLEAGRWAPSANNQQPWAFIVLQDERVRKEVARHAAYYLARQARVEEAPLIVVMCAHVRRRVHAEYLRGDVGMAGMQMMLQAHALGLGSCWVDGLDRPAIAKAVELPDSLEIVGLLILGFPNEIPAPTTRKPLFEIVHYDVYESLTFGGVGEE